MSIFLPELIVDKVMNIDIDLLERMGVKALILDVDNTLTTHGHPDPYEGVMEWLEIMKSNGIAMIISSNNTEQRVAPFADLLELEFVPMSCKPLPYGIGKAVKKFGLPKSQIAIIGDQIYTDVLGGNLKGIRTIMVSPFKLETGRGFRFKRLMERPWIKRYYKKQER